MPFITRPNKYFNEFDGSYRLDIGKTKTSRRDCVVITYAMRAGPCAARMLPYYLASIGVCMLRQSDCSKRGRDELRLRRGINQEQNDELNNECMLLLLPEPNQARPGYSLAATGVAEGLLRRWCSGFALLWSPPPASSASASASALSSFKE